MAKNTKKQQFAQFEINQTVRLTHAILRYSDAMRGIEFNPPQVLFAVGTLATVLERKAGTDSYVIVMADSTFVISRHASSLEAVPAPEDKPAEKLDAEYSQWANTVAGQFPAELAGKSFITDMPDADAEIAGLVDCLRKYAAAAAAIEEQKAALKERLTTLLANVGGKWQDAIGHARIVSGGTRISYDTDALDERIILEPDRYDWLRDLRTQTPVKPYVQVK